MVFILFCSIWDPTGRLEWVRTLILPFKPRLARKKIANYFKKISEKIQKKITQKHLKSVPEA